MRQSFPISNDRFCLKVYTKNCIINPLTDGYMSLWICVSRSMSPHDGESHSWALVDDHDANALDPMVAFVHFSITDQQSIIVILIHGMTQSLLSANFVHKRLKQPFIVFASFIVIIIWYRDSSWRRLQIMLVNVPSMANACGTKLSLRKIFVIPLCEKKGCKSDRVTCAPCAWIIVIMVDIIPIWNFIYYNAGYAENWFDVEGGQ